MQDVEDGGGGDLRADGGRGRLARPEHLRRLRDPPRGDALGLQGEEGGLHGQPSSASEVAGEGEAVGDSHAGLSEVSFALHSRSPNLTSSLSSQRDPNEL